MADEAGASGTKSCPACAEVIRVEAVKCRYCAEFLEQCAACSGWKTTTRPCAACAKVTAAREGGAAAPPPSMSPPPSPRLPQAPPPPLPARRAAVPRAYEFRGSTVELLFLHALRMAAFVVLLALVLGFLAQYLEGVFRPVARAIGGLPEPAQDAVGEAISLGMQPKLFVRIGLAVFAAAMLGQLNGAIRLYRVRHTFVFGRRLEFREGCFASFFHGFGNALLMLVTLGLASPWVVAGNRRFFHRSCRVKDEPMHRVDFSGTGVEVIGYTIVSILLAPFVVLTLGLLAWFVGWLWVAWDQARIRVPDLAGRLRDVRMTGTFAGYAGIALVAGVLTVISLGLLYPWGLVHRWRFLANHTEVLD